MNWEKYVFHLEIFDFETFMNSADATELLALGKATNKNIDYLMCYPR